MKTIKTSGLFAFIAFVFLTSCKKNSDNDPGNHKEKVLYQSDFNGDDPAWGTGENSRSNRTISNGYYRVYNKTDSAGYYSYTDALFSGLNDKIAIEAKLNVSGGTSNYPAFGGLIWNSASGAENVDVFGYYNSGSYEIFGYDKDNKFFHIKNTTASTAIKKNADNILRIEQRSGKFHYLINGTEVYASDANSQELDLTGFWADLKTTTAVDYFKAIQLP